jgi:ribonuclease HI
MDIRKFFPVEIKKKENQEPKKLKNISTTDGSEPFLSSDVILKDQISQDQKNSNLKKKTIVIHELWTDGSTFNNGKKNKKQYGGIGVFFKKDDPRNICKILQGSKITNNVAELTAILLGIQTIINTNLTPDFKDENQILIYSDSEYCINCITKWARKWKDNGWRKSSGKKEPIQNKELVERIYELYLKYKIRFQHVKAHQPEPYNKTSKQYKIWFGNHMADMFATHASKQSMN